MLKSCAFLHTEVVVGEVAVGGRVVAVGSAVAGVGSGKRRGAVVVRAAGAVCSSGRRVLSWGGFREGYESLELGVTGRRFWSLMSLPSRMEATRDQGCRPIAVTVRQKRGVDGHSSVVM